MSYIEMKKTVLILSFIVFFAGISLGQSGMEIIADMKPHMKSGNAREMTKYLNDIVEINIDGEKGSYSKTQAEFILRDFFKKYTPSDYQQIHKGSSADNAMMYTIGKYTFTGGSYRVYIVLKKLRGSYYIDTIDFSRE
ncbi:MAG: DUF4783 domain-containing protein [Cytophagaceae bacterium]|nr:DUF4783 domain-containing protein [Cytophagaceae bacterium]MDW8457373.1 DUF4783 domain-containing protein [Cytophagaceae bacterium]